MQRERMNGARGRRERDRRGRGGAPGEKDHGGERESARRTRSGRVYLFYSSSKETSASTGRKVSPARPPTVPSATRTWRQRRGHGEWIRVIENHWSFKLATRRCHYRVDLPAPFPPTPAHSLVSPLTRLPPHPTALFILFSRMVRFFLSLLSLSLTLSISFSFTALPQLPCRSHPPNPLSLALSHSFSLSLTDLIPQTLPLFRSLCLCTPSLELYRQRHLK